MFGKKKKPPVKSKKEQQEERTKQHWPPRQLTHELSEKDFKKK